MCKGYLRRDWRFYVWLIAFFGFVNRDTIGYEVVWVGECNACVLIGICELTLIKLGNCGAFDLADLSNCEFNSRMLSNFLMFVVYVQ